MRWLLARFCILALINLSVAQNDTLVVTQRPRFYGLKTLATAHFECYKNLDGTVQVQWFKSKVHRGTKELIVAESRIRFTTGHKSVLTIIDLNTDDSGVYFCKLNDTWGPGTGLLVAQKVNVVEAQYRTKMKDGLIFLQALLLAVFIAAVLLRKHSLLKRKDSLYEEPETDHIYESQKLQKVALLKQKLHGPERSANTYLCSMSTMKSRGLAIETCGGALYEELSVYTQAEGGEAPWE